MPYYLKARQSNRKLRREWSELVFKNIKMLSTEKSLFSPWPAVSSLSLSAWPTPAGGDSSDKDRGQALNNQINQANSKKPWKSNFAPNFTSSTDVSPTYNSKIQNISNFSFENVTSSRDLQIDNIDQLAAKLLNISDEAGELISAPSSDVVRPITTPSPNTTESDINLPIPASSSNAGYSLL